MIHLESKFLDSNTKRKLSFAIDCFVLTVSFFFMYFALLHSVIQPTHQMVIKPSFPFLQTSFLTSYLLLFDLHSQWPILFTCNTIKPYSFHLKSNTNKTFNKTMQKSWLCGITNFPVDTHCILIKCHTM